MGHEKIRQIMMRGDLETDTNFFNVFFEGIYLDLELHKDII